MESATFREILRRMSQENLDLVMEGFRAALTKPEPDYAALNRIYASDHVLVPLGGSLDPEGHGAEGYREWRARTEDLLGAEHEIRGAVDIGPDKVLAVADTRFTGASSGVSAEQRSWLVVTVRGGKIARTEAFSTDREALEAARLSE